MYQSAHWPKGDEKSAFAVRNVRALFSLWQPKFPFFYIFYIIISMSESRLAYVKIF